MSEPDPLTLAVIQAGLQQVCNEMDIAFSRAAFSPVIAEADDRSDGIYARGRRADRAGRAGAAGLRRHHGALGGASRAADPGGRGGAARARRRLHRQRPLSRRHASDGCALRQAVFVDGALFCWLQNTGHWPDIGGMVPGGFSAHATEVEQEGPAPAPVKLFKRGELDREILRSSSPTSASPTSASATSRRRRPR
jgi:N-methylhydantoinase B